MEQNEIKELTDMLVGLNEKYAQSQQEAKSCLDKVMEEVRSNGKAAEETKRELEANNEKMTAMDARIQEVMQELDAAKAARDEQKGGARDIVSQIVESPEMKSFIKEKGGNYSFEVENTKTVTTAQGSVGSAVFPQILPGVWEDPEFPLTIRSLLAPGSTTAQVIQYVKEGEFDDKTGMVKEAEQKPKSDLTLTSAETYVRKIANLIDVSMEALQDIPFLESYIRGKLMRGLKLKEEQQLLEGTGINPEIKGIIPQSSTFDDALLTQMDIETPTILDRIFAGIIQVNLSQYAPTAIVMNPIDYGAAIMRKTSDGGYLISNPTESNSPRLWGLRVVQSMNMEQGRFLVGAFRTGAQIFDRTAATITISGENKDNFEFNVFTLRIEERLALAVYSEKAFVYGLTAPSTVPGP